jgi:TatD DNase family protein
VDRAVAVGVTGIVVVGEGIESSEAARALCAGRDRLWPTAGLHPHRASEFSDGVARRLEDLTADPAVVAVGETGLDYHYDNSPREQQREAFAWHLARSAATSKPVIVHSREADDDTAAAILGAPEGTTGVLHCFSSGTAVLEAGLARGFCVSFSGMITFRTWSALWAVQAVPDDRLLIETDAPFLAPVPNRGKRNEPAFVAQTAAKMAELRGTSLDRLIALTTSNAERLFRVKSRA